MTPDRMARLHGLDLARFVAFVGMVIVNFKIVMMSVDAAANPISDGGWLVTLTSLLEGKAAATFVVLAGVGLGLAASRTELIQARHVTLRRAVFLLVIGLANTLIFDADILHYYAFYFLFGMLCLQMPTGRLLTLTVAIVLGHVALVLTFDYDTGWNWSDFTYVDFWTPAGFVRNLFYNGWHPVVPWLAFFLFGIMVSRWRLYRRTTQLNMILGGAGVAVAAGLISWSIYGGLDMSDPDQAEMAILVATTPVPPVPLFMVTGMAVATAVIGFCLLVAGGIGGSGLFVVFTAPGRQTLTLYVAHILIGMGTLEELGMLGNQTLAASVQASLYFCVAAMIYAVIWSRFFKRGPIEMLMRKLAG